MSKWPTVLLGDVLTQVVRTESVEPSRTYRLSGVRSFGGGCFDAGERTGAETKYQKLQRLRADDFVYPKLMAWEGAFAVVPASLDGTYVSPEFCSFEADPKRLDTRFLGHYFRWPEAWRRIAGDSSGTNVRRRRLYPEAFLEKAIRLPQIAEQQRIATQLDGILGKTEVLTVRTSTVDTSTILSLFPALLDQAFSSHASSHIRLSEAVDVVADSVKPGEDPTPAEAFIGLQHVETHTGRLLGFEPLGSEKAEKRRFAPADIVYGTLRPNLNKAWVADRPGLCSVDQRVLRPREGFNPTLVAHAMRSRAFLAQVMELVPGLQLPRIRLTKLLQLELPIVPVGEERAVLLEMSESLERVTRLVDLRRHRDAVVRALSPSVLNAAFSGAGGQ